MMGKDTLEILLNNNNNRSFSILKSVKSKGHYKLWHSKEEYWLKNVISTLNSSNESILDNFKYKTVFGFVLFKGYMLRFKLFLFDTLQNFKTHPELYAATTVNNRTENKLEKHSIHETYYCFVGLLQNMFSSKGIIYISWNDHIIDKLNAELSPFV